MADPYKREHAYGAAAQSDAYYGNQYAQQNMYTPQGHQVRQHFIF